MGQILLPKSFHPDFSRLGVKPAGPVEIDWSNPLVPDLVVISDGGSVRTLTNKNAIISGNPSRNGAGTTFDGDGDWATVDGMETDVCVTMLCHLALESKDNGGHTVEGILTKGQWASDTSGDVTIRGNVASQELLFKVSTVSTFPVIPYSSIDVGVPFVVLGVSEPNKGRIFKDGLLVDTQVSGWPSSVTPHAKDFVYGAYPNNEAATESNTTLQIAYVWKRTLSDGEILSISKNPYQVLKPAVLQTYFIPDVAAVTAVTTGTAEPTQTEAEVVTGGKTIILTLTGDTWAAAGTGPIGSTADTQAIIDGLDSAQSETFGWNAEVRDKEVTTAVVRTSDTVCTITLTAAAAYDITATETITATIPAAVLVTSAIDVVSSPTFTVTAVVSGFQAAWARSANQVIQ